MRRWVVPLAVSLALSLVFANAALAGPEWCSEDPVFSVNGIEVDITTGFDLANLQYARTATFELQVPSNVTAVALTVPGTIPITSSVSNVLPAWDGSGDIPVVSLVTVTGAKDFSISTQIVGMYGTLASWTPGTSNKTQRISFSLLHP